MSIRVSSPAPSVGCVIVQEKFHTELGQKEAGVCLLCTWGTLGAVTLAGPEPGRAAALAGTPLLSASPLTGSVQRCSVAFGQCGRGHCLWEGSF